MRTMPPPATSRSLLSALLSVTIAMVGAGCGDAGLGNDTNRPAAPGSRNTSKTATPTNATGNDTPQEDGMKIQIAIGEQHFEATLTESAAARDLLAQLPVTVDMVDHGEVEKTGHLPSPLSVDGQPEGADPDVGDVGYYVPGNDLVLYYGDQSYFPGIIILGQLDGDSAQRISELDGPITARVEAHGG